MQRKLIVLAIAMCLLVALSGLSAAATKQILLLAKPEQTDVLARYLESNFEITIANEEDILAYPNSEFLSGAGLAGYDAIFLGEIVLGPGNNGSAVVPQDLQVAIKDAVASGAGFIHIGGWTSYQGGNADWAGMWHATPIDEILPIHISSNWDTNDEGADIPRIHINNHPIVTDLDWRSVPRVGGYNRVQAAEGADVIVTDPKSRLPLIVAGTYGEGKTIAYTLGLGGGWDEDLIKWGDFPKLWVNIAQFLTQ